MSEKFLSEPQKIDVTGCVSPFKHDYQPWLIQRSKDSDYFVAVFATEQLLKVGCVDFGIGDYKIKQITNGIDFLESIKNANCRVMLNPYNLRNKTRWTEFYLDGGLDNV